MSPVAVTLRLSYKGDLKAVQVNQNISYQDVREISIDKFNINRSRSEKLELRDSSGNLYSTENFNRFMEVFPFDKRVLFLTTSSEPKANTSEDVRIPRTLSQKNEPEVKRLKKCRKFEKKRSTPVKRQNCFFGTLPASFVLGLQSPVAHQTDKKSRKFKGIRA